MWTHRVERPSRSRNISCRWRSAWTVMADRLVTRHHWTSAVSPVSAAWCRCCFREEAARTWRSVWPPWHGWVQYTRRDRERCACRLRAYCFLQAGICRQQTDEVSHSLFLSNRASLWFLSRVSTAMLTRRDIDIAILSIRLSRSCVYRNGLTYYHIFQHYALTVLNTFAKFNGVHTIFLPPWKTLQSNFCWRTPSVSHMFAPPCKLPRVKLWLRRGVTLGIHKRAILVGNLLSLLCEHSWRAFC